MKRRLIWLATAATIALVMVTASCSAAAAPSPAQGPRGGAPQGAGPRPGAMGTLAKIDGNTLTLTTPQQSVTVTVGPDTAIQKTESRTLSDLHEGQFLFAMGNADANGNVTAASIRIQPQGANPPGVPSGEMRGGPNRGGPGGPPQRQVAAGTLSKIDGNTLTLTTAQGTRTVSVDADTAIQETVTGAASDLKEGQWLSVSGTRDASGAVAATSIRIQPAPPQNGPSRGMESS